MSTHLAWHDERGMRVVQIDKNVTQNDWLAMREHFQQHIFTREVQAVAVDLGQHSQLPSLAFGVFASLAREARRLQIAFVLSQVGPGIRDILHRTHVDRLVAIRDLPGDEAPDGP